MTRVLKIMDRPGHPHRCGYRHKCKGQATHWYTVTFVNRYGNIKERCTTVCRECADAISNQYTVEFYG